MAKTTKQTEGVAIIQPPNLVRVKVRIKGKRRTCRTHSAKR